MLVYRRVPQPFRLLSHLEQYLMPLKTGAATEPFYRALFFLVAEAPPVDMTEMMC